MKKLLGLVPLIPCSFVMYGLYAHGDNFDFYFLGTTIIVICIMAMGVIWKVEL